MKIYYNSFVETQHCITSKVPNFKEKCLRQGKIPKSAYLKYFQTHLKSAYIHILYCSRLPSSRVYCSSNFTDFHSLNYSFILLKKILWRPEPFILGEFRYVTASGGWKKKLSMVHFKFLLGIFFFVKIESWNFQQLFDLWFPQTSQNFS